MNITIRPATLADADVIVEFNRLMALETEDKRLDPPTLTAGVKAMLADPRKGRYFLAEAHPSPPAPLPQGDRGEVVGQLGITLEWSDWRDGNFWWIQSVYVKHSARRHGVFGKLYQHVVTAARAEQDVIGVRLYVEHENEVAQATYRKMGMTMTGYRVMEFGFEAPG